MDAVHIPVDSVPPELKSTCEAILKRATELKKQDPVIAYWCCFSAAQSAVALPNRSKEATIFLMSLLDALEAMKALLDDNEAVSSEAAGCAYVENFALKIFIAADNEDRAGKANKATARKFLVASQFIEVLRCFENGMTEEMEQKLKYAKWKVTDIAKAIREGRKPTPGPPVPEETEEDSASLLLPEVPETSRRSSNSSLTPILPSVPQNTSRQASTSSDSHPLIPSPPRSPGSGSHHDDGPGDLPSIPSVPRSPQSPGNLGLPPKLTDLTESDNRSTVASSGAAIPGTDDAKPLVSLGSPPLPPTLPTEPRPRNSSVGSIGSAKAVRFIDEDGGPLGYKETRVPPPTEVSVEPPHTHAPHTHAAHHNDPTQGVTSPARALAPSPSAPPPVTPSYYAPTPSAPPPLAPLVHQPVQPVQQAPPAQRSQWNYPTTPARTLNRKETAEVQKHAKWAISALEFDDVETARKELIKALEMLN